MISSLPFQWGNNRNFHFYFNQLPMINSPIRFVPIYITKLNLIMITHFIYNPPISSVNLRYRHWIDIWFIIQMLTRLFPFNHFIVMDSFTPSINPTWKSNQIIIVKNKTANRNWWLVFCHFRQSAGTSKQPPPPPPLLCCWRNQKKQLSWGSNQCSNRAPFLQPISLPQYTLLFIKTYSEKWTLLEIF